MAEQLIALDLDGTTIHHDGSMSPAVRQAVREHGHRLGDRGPAKDARGVASALQLALGRERGNGDILGRPGVGDLERVQSRSILRRP